ncbi:MAG: phosphatase [Dethiobacteria bacterium]|jgi:putative hydrolase
MLKTIKLVADLHVHTLASGHAYSTVAEILTAAAQKGLEAVAFTDHGPAMPGGPHRYHFGNLVVLPEKENNVEILRGVEANIIDREGAIDLPAEYLRRLDLVWAGFHTPCLQPASRSLNTETLINALESPFVDGVVHPGNPDFPIDAEAVVRAVVEKRKLLEINNSSFVTIARRGSKAGCLEIARLIRRYGALVALNSDAHIAQDVGNCSLALEIAREAGIEPEQVVNSDLQILKEFLKKRGKKRFLSV